MNVPLSEHWMQFLREKVRSGQFASEAEVIEASLRLLEEHGPPAETALGSPTTAPARQPIWERIEERAGAIPEEEFLKLPADGAEQHDHDLHGTPKCP